MAFCSKCGTKLTDGAKYCPNCGEQVNQQSKSNEQPKGLWESFRDGIQEGIAENKERNQNKSYNRNQEESLSIWVKIALGVSAFFAFMGICGGFADGMWIVGFVSLCAMGAVCAVYMGIIEKKYAWVTAIGSLFVVVCTIGASANDERREKPKQTQTEQKQVTQEEQAREEEEREKKEQEQRKQDKINEIKRIADREARITAQALRYTESWSKHCQSSYISSFGTPSSDEDFEMYDIYKEEFRKYYFATLDAMQKMN